MAMFSINKKSYHEAGAIFWILLHNQEVQVLIPAYDDQ